MLQVICILLVYLSLVVLSATDKNCSKRARFWWKASSWVILGTLFLYWP